MVEPTDEVVPVTAVDEKRMKLRYAGTCRLCGAELPARCDAVYERATKTVRCVHCPNQTDAPQPDTPTAVSQPYHPPTPVDPGVAGSSARKEYERRRAKDEQHLRDKWGRFGGLAVALADERQSTAAWDKGAIGEERLGARLDALVSADFAVLHDRRIPRSRANIDHIVITRSGVWVIDAKRYQGRPQLRIAGGILRPRVETLVVGRRDCTRLVDGVLKQVGLVREVVGNAVPVSGVLCFVEADWPLIGGAFTTQGVQVMWPRRLAKVLCATEPSGTDVAAVRAILGARFQSA